MDYKGYDIATIHNGGKFIILNEGTLIDEVPEEIRNEFPYPFRLAGDDFYGWDDDGSRYKDLDYITDYGLSKINPEDAYDLEYALPLDEYGMGMNGDTIIEYFVDGEWQDCAIG